MMMMMIPEKWGRPHQWHTRSQHFHLNKKERLFLDLTLDLRRDLRPPVSDLRLFCDCHSCRICQVGSDKEIMLTKTVILLLFFHFTGFECIMLTAVCNGDANQLAELIRQDPGFFSFFFLSSTMAAPLRYMTPSVGPYNASSKQTWVGLLPFLS